MRRMLRLGCLFLFLISLFACSSEAKDETGPAPQPGVTVFAPAAQDPVETPPVAAPTAAGTDGSVLVAYEKSGSLWTWRSGSPAQLTDGTQDSRPQISADGALVAFQRGNELWMIDSVGGNLRKIYAEQGVQPQQFEFAPESHLLYFSTAAIGGAARFDLQLADANKNVVVSLLPAGQAGKFTFAPDGSLLALVQADRIMTCRPDGSALKLVHQFPKVQGSQGEYLPAIAWLDNAYGFKTVIPAAAGGLARLMFIMAEGGQAAQLAEFPAVSPAISDVYIAPDGSKVLYLRAKGENLELHVIDASTADSSYFEHAMGKLGLLGWTPDSQGLLYWLDDPRSAWFSNGNSQTALSDAAFAEHLRWISQDLYLFVSQGELRLRRLGQPSQVIDSGVGGYAAMMLK